MSKRITNNRMIHDYEDFCNLSEYVQEAKVKYKFNNFFHPFIGELIEKLNKQSLPGIFDPNYHQSLVTEFFKDYYEILSTESTEIVNFSKEIDVSERGPYCNYNWELLFHVPLTIAVHLSKNQRFAEAQHWFHYIFDPTCNDTRFPTPQRFWKFLAFRQGKEKNKNKLKDCLNKTNPTEEESKTIDSILEGKNVQYMAFKNNSDEILSHYELMDLLYDGSRLPINDSSLEEDIIKKRIEFLNDDNWKIWEFHPGSNVTQIDELLALLSKPNLNDTEQKIKKTILGGYEKIKEKPFQPHVIARTRNIAYQYYVVMKYLDNLIAWGDNLFLQDTVESINEATQRYVLAANILGTRPQRIPSRGTSRPKTFAELRAQKLDEMGNLWVDFEGKFPLIYGLPNIKDNDSGSSRPLFGIGHTLYFCVPRNDKMLEYWDKVADRLFKIRHCMNIEGVVRQLALFDPPLDPGMLVKAAAAGINIGSIISGMNQPVSPVRSLFFIQKTLELCAEVRGLGNSLLSAIEKGDSERMALLRQSHEIEIQQMQKDVRFLQWKQAQESTESLLLSRDGILERYKYYQRLLGLTINTGNVPDRLPLDREKLNKEKLVKLTEEKFDEIYKFLIEQYQKPISIQSYTQLKLEGDTSPITQSGASGKSNLYLNSNENSELNEHAPNARDLRLSSMSTDTIAGQMSIIPDVGVNFHWWGLGGHMVVFGGSLIANQFRFGSSVLNILAINEEGQSISSSKTSSYERRADDWILQSNLAAHELIHIGKQIIGSLIAEQIAYHEYQNIQKQIENSQAVDQFLKDKFTNEELYAWMQGEISRLYYEYYRFAFDTARKAEQTMKKELMRPEVDAKEYIKFNYWDGGRKGLLSGEALYLDVKRLEMDYHENNKREYELTKHVSLRQLNPLALLALKASGICEITLPEWLFDLDCPGHYMRRIKNVSVSIPSVTGPYTSVNCTLSLLKSAIRKSPLLKEDEYYRRPDNDDRFIDYFGTIQSIVTSSGNNDSGMFETNLRDERFLPFEGSGVESTWKLELPSAFRQFDYDTISDVILHIRYTAREGGAQLRDKAVDYLETLVKEGNKVGLFLLFDLKHDFPYEWNQFVTGNSNFTAKVKRDYFPYFSQGKNIKLELVKLCTTEGKTLQSITPKEPNSKLQVMTDELNKGSFVLSLVADGEVLVRKQQAQVFAVINYSIESA